MKLLLTIIFVQVIIGIVIGKLLRRHVKKLWIILLLPSFTYANDLVSVGPGIIKSRDNNFYSLNVTDMNYFSQLTKHQEYYRYGYGTGGMQIGNGFGVNLMANSGMSLLGLEDKDGIKFHLGADFGGKLILNTNPNVNSYYQWLPALTVGSQIGWNKNRLLLLLKGGGSAGNYDKPGFWPKIHSSYGAGIYSTIGAFNLGINKLNFGDNKVLMVGTSVVLEDFELGIQAETWDNIPGKLKDHSVNMLVKANLF